MLKPVRHQNYLRVQEPEGVIHLLDHSFDNSLGLEYNRKYETTVPTSPSAQISVFSELHL